jgi:hypothetical protein
LEEIWQQIKSLFVDNDGSLPDIYIEPLTDRELISAYNFIRTLCSVPEEATLWSRTEERDVAINSVKEPAAKFVAGEVEMFRHGLDGLEIEGVAIPQLTVEVSKNQLSFDYKPGPDWGLVELKALFEFLKKLRGIAPQSRVFQADEGCYDNPNNEFEVAFGKYLQNVS